jgi:hypothetical protein
LGKKRVPFQAGRLQTAEVTTKGTHIVGRLVGL